MAAGFDFEHGGMQLPYVVERACFAWFHGAPTRHRGVPVAHHRQREPAARARHRRSRSTTYVRPMLDGPVLRHDVPVRAAGRLLAGRHHAPAPSRSRDGSYRLFGNKMWISGGDHELTENIVHLVLAKMPDGGTAPGVKGISLFVVPKFLSTPTARSASATTSRWPG